MREERTGDADGSTPSRRPSTRSDLAEQWPLRPDPANRPSCLVDVVLDYYRAVDAGDVDGLLDLFAHDAEYRRPGYPAFVGRDALRAFYEEGRVIGSGQHTILTAEVFGTGVAVQGEFEGETVDGRPLALEFADFFEGSDVITRRQTYFYAPLA